jgi:HAD superfamily hydrolase (TIGR01450 family)
MPLRGCPQPLAVAYDTALLDLDGVVYVGREAVPGAAEALAAAREGGMRLAFVTNNAARTPETVARHLTEIGVPARAEEVVTSAQAAASVVAGLVPPGAPVLVIGGDGLVAALRERGLRPVWSTVDAPAAVVQGFAPTVDWRQLTEGALTVARGVPWVASNLDRTIPVPGGRAPGNGAFVEVVRIATDREPVAVAGKPEVPLHQESIRRSGARRPLVVGDRLDTDIEGAVRGGSDSLLVLTGVTTPELALHAPPEARPTYVAADLRALSRPQPEVTATEDGRWRCGGWTATVTDGAVRLDGGGEADDALRAACAAAWTSGEVVEASAVRRLYG